MEDPAPYGEEEAEVIDEEALLKYCKIPKGTMKQIRNLSDEGLAAWESGWRDGHAKRLLAQREWERRSMRASAKIGILGTAIGAVLGWLISLF